MQRLDCRKNIHEKHLKNYEVIKGEIMKNRKNTKND